MTPEGSKARDRMNREYDAVCIRYWNKRLAYLGLDMEPGKVALLSDKGLNSNHVRTGMHTKRVRIRQHIAATR